MRCIFCKLESNNSISIEHIIPESLGNTEYTLPRGWVCDGCNNYFARKIEKPFLESLYGRSCRFQMAVENKQGRIPSVEGIHPQSRTKVVLFRSTEDDSISVSSANQKDESRLVASIQSRSDNTLYVPAAFNADENSITSRFIGKIALEIIAFQCLDIAGSNDEIVNNSALDELRKYVRTGQKQSI